MSGYELQKKPSTAPSPEEPVPPDPSWTALEGWVWEKLRAGAIASIDHYADEHGRLPPADPRKLEDWQDGRRRLTSRFLEDLLLREPYRSGLHRNGVCIEGAWFDDEIDLSMAELAHQLRLTRGRFEKAADLTYLRTPAPLSLEGSCFAAQLDLQSACIDASLFLRNGAEFADVVLSAARIGGQVDLRGAKLARSLHITSAEIGQSLLMASDHNVSEQRSEFNHVVLGSAKVGGQVVLIGAKVAGTLDMDSAEIGQAVLMRSDRRASEHRAEFSDVVLRGAKIGGQVDLTGAKVAGTLDADFAEVRHSLHMRSDRGVSEHQAEFSDVVLRRAKVGGQVVLIGAKVAGTLNMDSASVGMSSDRSVSEHRAEFNEVVLRGAKVGGQVVLIGAKVAGTLNMDSASVGQSLHMRSDRGGSEHRAEFSDVVLRSTKVGGQAVLIGAKVAGTLNMDSASVGQSLLMSSDRSVSEHRAEFNEVVLRGAKVGGQVDLTGAKITERLYIDSADIGLSLLMRSDREVSEQHVELKDVFLRGTRIGGQVALIGAKVAGKLAMDSVSIGESLITWSDRSVPEDRAEFDGDVSWVFIGIGRNLDLRGAAVSSVNLTGARIGGQLTLASASSSPHWHDGGKLVLRNASVDAIQDTDENVIWPPVLDLDGFTYRRFGGLRADAESSVAKRGSRWFVDWLARHEPYMPQPYQQCAQVLREMGHPEMATDVLFAGRERERKQAWRTGDNPRGTGLTLLKWFVGYGYGQRLLWRPLGWAFVIVVFGALLPEIVGLLPVGLRPEASSWCAEISEVAPPTCLADHPLGWRFLFSLDMLLPIIELSREHSVLQAGLDGIAYGWFVVQRLLGWVLALFLIAGLTGLTK